MASKLNKLLSSFRRKEALNAKNTDKSSDLFYKRVLYKQLAYSPLPVSAADTDLLPIRNFQNFENYLYGRVNLDFESIVPRKIYLSPVGEKNNFALSFVSSAFLALQKEIKMDIASGVIPAGIPYISDMKAYRSYEDINVNYNSWALSSIKNDFLAYVEEFEDKRKIIDFESFMVVFRRHLEMLADQTGAVTISSFCMGDKSNIKNSGLVVEVANLDFSKDEEKMQFSDSIYFSYYIEKAEKFGFFVDYNAPWRLIANLASPVMASRAGYSGLYSFFSKYYEPAHKKDIEILKNASFSTYRDYVNAFPTFRLQEVSPSGCIRDKLVVREKISKNDFAQKYSDRYWLSVYVNLKNAEKNLGFKRDELEKIKKNALDYEKYVDINRSLGYINKVYQDIPSLEGSFYSSLNKEIYKDQSPLPFEDFDRFIREAVKSYRKKTR